VNSIPTRLLVWLAAVFAIAGAATAPGAFADDADSCVKAAGDERIAACTRVIQSGRSSGPSLAWAYVDRGIATLGKHSGQEKQRPKHPLRDESAKNLRVECGARGPQQP
jgi:hypothetical protein